MMTPGCRGPASSYYAYPGRNVLKRTPSPIEARRCTSRAVHGLAERIRVGVGSVVRRPGSVRVVCGVR
eukprot:3460296-Rhodomonas_salina.3